MKKTTDTKQTRLNKRGLAARCASAIVCSALLLLGATSNAAAPANDNFASAITVSPTASTISGSNVDATRETNEPNHSPSEAAGGRSVWWTWTPSTSGGVQIDTGGSESNVDTDGLDTQLAVYTGSSLSGLTLVANNEDSVLFSGGRSAVTFNAVAGTTYRIAVDGWNGEQGTVKLNFSTGTVTNPPAGGFTLTTTANGSGTITRNPDKTTYDTNETVTLTANPTGTNTFLGWGGDASSFGSTNPITITMDANKNVTASFTTSGGGGGNTFVLTVNKTPTSSSGTVRQIPNKARYDEGEVVTVVARAARGRTFEGWTGTDQSSSDVTNTVTMTSDKTITAAFSTAPGPDQGAYAAVVGTYNGLFYDSAISTNCSGYFSAKISKTGRINVRLNKGGKTVTANGQLDSTTGAGTATVGRDESNTVQIQLDMTGANTTITGTVNTGDCVAALEGDKVVYSAQNPSPIQGTYTFVLPRTVGTQTNEVVTTNNVVVTNNPGTTNETVVTNSTFETNTVVTENAVISPGHGYASMTISKLGAVRIRGALADGSKFNQSTTISSNGEVPFYIPLYRGHGLLLGWLNVTQGAVAGDPVNWKRPAGGLLFPDGFDADLTVFGSRFDRTVTPLINLGSNAIVEIGGNAFNNSTNESGIIPVEFSNANTLSGSGENGSGLQIRLLPTGLVRGKFTSSVTGKVTPLQGAMIQSSNAAYGYFLNAAGSRGFFELRNDEAVVAAE